MTRTLFSKAALAAVAVAAVLTSALIATPAYADTAPVDPASPASPTTVSADALPTVQVNGVVWQQAIVGDTVYAVGNFSQARPAGAAAGVNTTARSNILAYKLSTGELIQSFAPSLTGGEAISVAASPDGSRIYVGGSFTAVNGATVWRIAALNPTTGALITSFLPKPASTVRAIVATNDAVYFGGLFTSVGTDQRLRLAAAKASDGSLLPWAPAADGGRVNAIVLSPDKTKAVVGGQFTTVNGSSNPGYGVAAVNLTDGALLPFGANSQVRNGGTQAGITSLTSDNDSVYGTGYVFGSGGNLENSFRASWDGGDLKWVADCHGDTYSAAVVGDVVYTAGHAHYCGNIGGFPQTDPWSFYRGIAFSKSATGTATPDIYGYPSWGGTASPTLLNWFPNLDTGTATGQNQGPWAVSANTQYVVMGGEFKNVNGSGQQGLVRFAVSSKAPNTQGPVVTGSRFNPTVTSSVNGQARIRWTANWDRDNKNLTYQVIRDGNTARPVYTTTQESTFWQRPSMGYVDTGLTPGQTYRYRVFATDPFGNIARSDTITVTIASGGQSSSAYSASVLADSPQTYYRFGESSGTTAEDWAGFADGNLSGTISQNQDGSGIGDTNTSYGFAGDNSTVTTPDPSLGPDTFTVESWVKTTTTNGGKIIGFGNTATGNSSNYDRQVYMDNAGRIWFGVHPGGVRTVNTSKSYNDGQWHHIAASLSSAGMKLYVDGRLVASRADVTSGQPGFTGYWRIGGDNLGGWTNQPNSYYLAGNIDEVAIYDTALSQDSIVNHFVASGRTSPIPAAPADSYGASVYNLDPSIYWRLGETSGQVAADSSKSDHAGTYTGRVNQGVDGAIAGSANKAATFDPINQGGWQQAGVASQDQFSSPSSYALELWFKTTTTRGGKLIGFGSSQTGTSGSYDRHVYMEPNGALTFGTWTGQTNTITSPAGYNDGTWHHLVAEQSSAGMKLYVDGSLKGTNPQTSAQDYSGYWRIAGDTTWNGTDPFFAGTLDEVAVYPTPLTNAQVENHYALGTGVVPNVPPTASFTATATDLHAQFDATASTDSDGTIASYAWDFGDGTTGTGATTTHDYTTAGAHTVTLTVTDNKGATATTTRSVTTKLPNVAPVAAYSPSATNLQVAFDASASADSDGTIASYAWQFGDGTTGTGVTTNHTYAAAGSYQAKLTVTDNEGAIGEVTQTIVVSAPVLVAPTSHFTAAAAGLTVNVDGSTSTDADGTIVSHAWNFGDGQTGTGATATHGYAAAGTYTITHTVTDNDGLTGSSSSSVTVTAPANVLPTAAFTATPNGLTVAVDGSASTDSDGTIASYAWNFGDNGTGTGATASHTYTAAGTYTVSLTVTDNRGGTNTITHSVVVTAPQTPTSLANDTFTRAVTGGLGAANSGGTWSITGGTANASVTGGKGVLKLTKAGAGVNGSLSGVSSTSTDASVTFSLDKVADGGGAFVSLAGRQVSAGNDYRAKVKVASNGALTLYITRTVGGAETTLKTVALTGTYTAGTEYTVRVQVDGSNATTINAKAWRTSTAEPATWQTTTTDTTAALQAAGTVGVMTYLSGSSTNFPVAVSFDNLSAVPVGAPTTPQPPANVAPTAAFTQSAADLALTVDASTSSDSDGTIVSYAWDFGDGTLATGVTATHSYAAAGSYTVRLTVTDNAGATGTVTSVATVTAPVVPPVDPPVDPAAAFATDTFERTQAGGFGTADTGGAWTIAGGAANASVAAGKGVLKLTKAGAGVNAFLPGVSAASADVAVNFTLDKLADGGGAFVSLAGRQVSPGNDYRAKVKVASNGAITLYITKTVAGVETTLKTVAVAGAFAPGTEYTIRTQVSGSGTTTINAKVWSTAGAEPAAWQTTTTDTSAELQGPGTVALLTYLSGSSTNFPVSVLFDGLVARPVQ
ncbi:PKD domain-containing protein [Plantibacter flavus]|uniref:PKD domain-containing protein n=1 Tax=Plantibacter flavus TaxID=150123 RepID=UPI003F1730EA